MLILFQNFFPIQRYNSKIFQKNYLKNLYFCSDKGLFQTFLKEKSKQLFHDMFSPFIYIWRFILKYYETSFEFLKKNKEVVIILTYWLWLLLQSAFLFFSFGIEWLNYLSFKFSLILLAILLFLGFIWLPLIFLFIVFSFLYIFLGLLPLLISLALIWALIWKYFHDFFDKEKFNNFDKKMNWIYVFSTFMIFILLWSSFISQYSVSKPIELLTEHNWKVIWDLIFYNQDYYFINNCDEKIIIPNSEITGVHYLCPIIWCSESKKIWIKKLKTNYCNILKRKIK